MATPGRTQKQIAERYKGNLGYYKRKHPWRVARWCASSLAIVGGISSIFIYQRLVSQRRVSEEFFSAGELSLNHAALAEGCGGCHSKAAAAGNDRAPVKFQAGLKERLRHGIDFGWIDRSCQDCHEGNPPFKPKPAFVGHKDYQLHEPNVVENRACSVCHQEHLGLQSMKRVADWQCASCHGNKAVMEASAKKGTGLAPAAFRLRPHPPQQVVFEMPRPRDQLNVISSFAGNDHPEFQLVREKARDPDGLGSSASTDGGTRNEILRFNHQLHFGPTIPPVEKNRKLDCNYCHQPDSQGRFYQRINFEANCQACHALLFDKNNPQLQIPHAEVNLVRNFLRTLPAQYGDYARLKMGKTREGDVQTFVAEQIKQLRAQFDTGEKLERAVFFETSPYKAQKDATAATRANFSGCAYCHEIKLGPNSAPILTKPILVDRWMTRANFNHAKHATVKCDDCHHATQSRETANILMPAKADCVTCHSPKGKVVSDCITCHTYHTPAQVAATEVQADARESFKAMLLGRNR